MQRLGRLANMIDRINRGRAPSVDDFCREFEVRQRTVYEDIRFLKEEMGIEIEFDRDRQGYINRNPEKKLPEFDLNEGEFFVLTLGQDMLAQYSGTMFEPYLRGALDKIAARLPDGMTMSFSDVRSLVRFQPGGIPLFERKVFFDMNKACEMCFPVEISYYSASTSELSENRKINPYRTVERKGVWYVVAWCHLRNDLRMFALHRIRDYKKIEDERFRINEGLDIDKYLKSAFQLEHGDGERQVKIKFNPIAARFIRERIWHESQKLEEHDDGSCTLEFLTQSLDEVKRWVLYYGANAEVLQPSELRDLVRDEFAAGALMYQK
jgi:predicted DNA-binding transcriptional regulator YafY